MSRRNGSALGETTLSTPLFALQNAQQAKATGDEHWWKLAEAAVTALCRDGVIDAIIETIKTGKVRSNGGGEEEGPATCPF